MLLAHRSGAAPLRAFAFFRDPTFVIGVPVLAVGLFYNIPAFTGLGLSLIACALIIN
ncbi:hypothetical protein [Pseudomonas sp. Bc-h]|jgi:hypothetical protein|uniref:hypothetical protein n=1 Tax=Pseudomonas sp. Bc-h TaxID=1943632 RepID=UPI00143D5910|nr:hypothetical protein [Pseudomonas sp. Bc-h]